MKHFVYFILLIVLNSVHAQNNRIKINAILDTKTHELKIQQETVFFNQSEDNLEWIYFHNWPNAYKDKNTPLAKRFVENYSKTFHFAKDKQRGFTHLESISINYVSVNWEVPNDSPDILKVHLDKPLSPGDSTIINAVYTVKIPLDKFTSYGVNTNTNSYNLKYWYLIPAIYSGEWHLQNNLDMDDLYSDYTDYSIDLHTPHTYFVNSHLKSSKDTIENRLIHRLSGQNQKDVELNITPIDEFVNYNFNNITITTNLNTDKLNQNLRTSILKREFYFLQLYLGKYPQKKLFINKISYDKNPVYGFNQLPSFLATYADTFEWDIKLFKALTKKYLEQLFLVNKREDYWLIDGLHTYLMIKYVETYYPEVKAIGNISQLFGIKKFNLAQISFNEKYPFVYQFAARKNLDQPLTMRADSLSNFNRKIVNPYKAGLGLKYLETYVDDLSMKESIYEFSLKNKTKNIESTQFINLLKVDTKKDLSWFEGDYLNSNKKIDYTIKEIEKRADSIAVKIKNMRSFTAPVQLFGLQKDSVIFEKWLNNIDTLETITVPRNGIDKLSLNYNFDQPEYNLRNNWKTTKRKLINRPLQIKFFRDIENPYYNQFFYTPVVRYNYYDGLVMGITFSNKTLLNKSFTYKITPSYSSKSKTFSGSYGFLYEYLPENKKINKFQVGISGSNYHYAENLFYTSYSPYALLEFHRKSLRDVSSKTLIASYTSIDRERSPTQEQHPETTSYGVFNLSFGYSKPEIIDDFRFRTGLQFSKKFSKVSMTARFRKLTDTNRQFDFRIFAGAFLKNNTETDFFSFALDRPTDYLFQYEYFGRSENSGFFSQQIIINEGGFKSKLPVPYGNQWLTTLNSNIGLWRWLEVYNDVGFVKNRGEKVYFAYESGIRFNFIQDILEVYFPFYSNLGWEIAEKDYATKIRFVLVLNPKRIYNFIKRGFY